MTTKILDNKNNGKVIDELRENLEKSSKLSIISAYFTIYAYHELKKELSKVDSLRFLFTEQSFKKQDEEPHVPMGEHCNCPYECWYIGYCKNKK